MAPIRSTLVFGEADVVDGGGVALGGIDGEAEEIGDTPGISLAGLCFVKDAVARTQAINQLKSVLITADPALREELAGLGNAELFHTCARGSRM
ncbi:hypothetical protein [Streptomyces curacoi]|uniref:hypothetical protein n=1 Tax=Streptomyces curacoi TaxID=146536 RepID=UPI000B02EF20|nr:hypothetical protein [Streptomyces curacoi]